MRRSGGGGRSALLVGAVISGGATYGYQVIGVRVLGETAYAPVSVLWSVQFLVFAVLLFPFEAFIVGGPGRVRLCLEETAGLAVLVGAGLWLAADRLPGDRELLALVGAATVLSYGAFTVGRGLLTVRGDAGGYAFVTGGEAAVRLLLTLPVALVGASPAAIAALLPVGPPIVLGVLVLRRRLRRRPVLLDVPEPVTRPVGGWGHLVAGTAANAGAQLLLAAGPLVVPLIGGGPREVTLAFVTLTAARMPVFMALGGLVSARLPVLVALAREGRHEELVRTVRRTVLGGLVAAALAAPIAALVGPGLLALLLGQGVRPPPLFVAVTAAGVMLTSAALLVNQVVVVRGQPLRLVFCWSMATVASAVVLLVAPVDPLLQVGSALVVGQALALAGLVVSAGHGGHRSR